MSDIAQHILSLLTLSIPENATSPPPPSDDPRVPASATDTSPSTSSTSCNSDLVTLRARVAHLLTVFDDPHYANLDVLDWVRRAAPLAHHTRVTVRGLVEAMCDAARELGLADGERYVLDAICACADAAAGFPAAKDHTTQHKTRPTTEEGAKGLARRLQHLASAWVAFLLWPFYARMKDPESWARGYASPCMGLSHTPKAMAFGEFDPDECIPTSSYPLRDQILARDGQRCVVSGVWDVRSRVRAPPGMHRGYVDAVRIFKHPLVVYKDVYDHDKARLPFPFPICIGKRESVLLSLEVLHQFCQLDSRYINIAPPGSAGVMDDPANLLSLCCNAHAKFDAFALCFVPTQCANTYKVIDHDPHLLGLPRAFPELTLPRTVTFEDLTPNSTPVSLPSSDLLRAHAALGHVLYASGAAGMFERIEDEEPILDPERPDVHAPKLPVPDPDGASFWRDLVAWAGDSDAGGAGMEIGTSLRLISCQPGMKEMARVLGVATPSLPTTA